MTAQPAAFDAWLKDAAGDDVGDLRAGPADHRQNLGQIRGRGGVL